MNPTPSDCVSSDLGYYIHSCVKMRYKANFRPQYILGKSHLLPALLWLCTIIGMVPDPV